MTHTFGCKRYKDKIGVLLAQLGTPDAPTKSALFRYLRQFLWDPRVIEKNRALWWLILHLFVLTKRPARSAALYKRIWTAKGSPLLLITQAQHTLLSENFKRTAPDVEMEIGMRYGSPSIEQGIDKLIEKGCSRILLFPMYPQYSGATTASTYDVVFAHLLKRRWVPTLKVAEPYYAAPEYISALAATINDAYACMQPKPERLVLSYHGIPQAYVDAGDPYCCMCTETTKHLLPLLNIPKDEVIHTYQSRFGRDPWLTPYTDETIKKLAQDGVTRIAVAAPGFTADCLETLDELGHEGQKLFAEHGGKEFHLIPCLNDSAAWIFGMSQIIEHELGWWLRSLDSASSMSCPMKIAAGG